MEWNILWLGMGRLMVVCVGGVVVVIVVVLTNRGRLRGWVLGIREGYYCR